MSIRVLAKYWRRHNVYAGRRGGGRPDTCRTEP